MNSSIIQVKNIPKGIGAFLYIAIRSKPIFLAYHLALLIIFFLVIALENNNIIGQTVVIWVSGITLLSSLVFLSVAPWISNQFRVIMLLVITYWLYQWW
jgi:hypothetical protein